MEADVNWADFSSKVNYDCNFPCGSNGHDVLIENDWNWFGTFRGRAGVAVENVLAFVTGGLAVGRVGHTWTEFDDPPDSWAKFGGTRVGVVVGGGIEWGVTPEWSAKAEGLYVDLGESSSPTNGKGFKMDVRDTAYVARLGLNYRPR
jgi:outer membrane immunogenic protein